ncbi:MAG: helix-turn-helix transcriptional regulator [Clostridia bacterium]|nr:helix-turn-helix transcriptional regulator [Clostridia bacterium]
MLATLADSYLTQRTEFQMTHGYQPIDSLFFIKEGSFFCHMNKKSEVVTPGCLAVFERNTLMDRHVVEPLTFLYVKYHKKKNPLLALRSGIYRELSPRALADLSAIESLSGQDSPLSMELRTHYLNDLMLQLVGEVSADPVELPRLPNHGELPVEYMREHLSKGIAVEEVARHAGMSVSALEEKFRRVTGLSVYRYFITMRMEHAKQLLGGTGLSITEIADVCGYDNLFYFCNAFKKHSGMTPSQYRKSSLV